MEQIETNNTSNDTIHKSANENKNMNEKKELTTDLAIIKQSQSGGNSDEAKELPSAHPKKLSGNDIAQDILTSKEIEEIVSDTSKVLDIQSCGSTDQTSNETVHKSLEESVSKILDNVRTNQSEVVTKQNQTESSSEANLSDCKEFESQYTIEAAGIVENTKESVTTEVSSEQANNCKDNDNNMNDDLFFVVDEVEDCNDSDKIIAKKTKKSTRTFQDRVYVPGVRLWPTENRICKLAKKLTMLKNQYQMKNPNNNLESLLSLNIMKKGVKEKLTQAEKKILNLENEFKILNNRITKKNPKFNFELLREFDEKNRNKSFTKSNLTFSSTASQIKHKSVSQNKSGDVPNQGPVIGKLQRRKLKKAAKLINRLSKRCDETTDNSNNSPIISFNSVRNKFQLSSRVYDTTSTRQTSYGSSRANPWNKPQYSSNSFENNWNQAHFKQPPRGNYRNQVETWRNIPSERNFESNNEPHSSQHTFHSSSANYTQSCPPERNSYSNNQSFSQHTERDFSRNDDRSYENPSGYFHSNDEGRQSQDRCTYGFREEFNINDYSQEGTVSSTEMRYRNTSERDDISNDFKHKTGKKARKNINKPFDKSLKVAVVSKSFPQGNKLTSLELSLFSGNILALIEKIPNGAFAPSFERTILDNGAIMVTCSNEDSKKWLRDQMRTLKPWPEAELKVIQQDNVNNTRFFRGSMWVPDDLENPYLVLELMAKQNPGLHTQKWRIYNNNVIEGKGQMLILGITPESIPILEEKNFRPHWNLTRLKIELKKLPRT